MPSPLTIQPGAALHRYGRICGKSLLCMCLSSLTAHAQSPWPPIANPEAGLPGPAQAHIRYEPAGYDEIPGWREDNLLASLRGLRQTCTALSGYDPYWSAPCAELAGLGPDSELVRQFYQRHFVVYRIAASSRPSLGGVYDPSEGDAGIGHVAPSLDHGSGDGQPPPGDRQHWQPPLGVGMAAPTPAPHGPLPGNSQETAIQQRLAGAGNSAEESWVEEARGAMGKQDPRGRNQGAERLLGAALERQADREAGRAKGGQDGLGKIVELQRRWKEAKGFLGSLGLGPKTRGQRGATNQPVPVKPLSDEELHRLLASLEVEASPKSASSPRPPTARPAPRATPSPGTAPKRVDRPAVNPGERQEEVAAYIAALSRPAPPPAQEARPPDLPPVPAPAPAPPAPVAMVVERDPTPPAASLPAPIAQAEQRQASLPTPAPAAQDGPVGTLGVPLTAGRSLSVSPGLVPPGSPVFIDAGMPGTQARLQRLVFAQDSRLSSTGQPETTLFWGSGEAAQRLTETTGGLVQMWLLLPRGQSPGG